MSQDDESARKKIVDWLIDLILQTEPERQADKRDAERYRWLRSHPVFQVKELPNELELLDACIDRYMAGKETEE